MPLVIALFAALTVMILIYSLFPVATSTRVRQFEVVTGERGLEASQTLPLWRALLLPLHPLVERYMPRKVLHDTETRLWWAQFGGDWLGWDAPSFWAMSIACGLAGAIGGLLMKAAGMVPFVGLLAAYLPTLLLNNKARRQRKEFLRQLPEIMQLVAMLVSVGHSTPEALRMVAQYQGSVARFLALGIAQGRGRVFLSREVGEKGVLMQLALTSGAEEAASFVAQLELIEQKGTGAEELLTDLARDQVSAFRTEAMERAKKLSSQLVFPILLFDFLPYLLVIGAPLMFSMFTLFAG
jgi:Flp pilus assembly protein TadB